MIVIARNPLDVFPSFANLCNLQSHSLTPQGEYHIDYPEFWDSWVKQLVANMKSNHEEVLKSMAQQIPTYFMRFEDLRCNPVPSLTGLFKFLLNVESLEGTVCEKRIQEVTASGHSDKTAYRLKSNTSSLCR